MRLTPIPRQEPTVKHSFALKKSTTELLQQYQAAYKSMQGAEVSLKDLVEQMLVDFMADDKAFQKFLKKPTSPVTAKPAEPSALPAIAAQAQPSEAAASTAAPVGASVVSGAAHYGPQRTTGHPDI